MADFTTTTNLNLKKPAVGGSSDKWGEYLNSDLDTIDSEIQSLKTASTSRSLESLSNVLDTTPTTGQLLQYGTASWRAATVTIPDGIEDLGNVTVSSPADGEVLAWSASNARWENQSAGVATIPAGSITTAKLSTSLQGQINLILQTTGTPTDNQILQYNSTTTNWEFVDLPGGTVSALSDTDVSGITNQDVLVYNSTSGDWVSRPLAIADVTGLQAQLDAKLESSDLSVSSLTDTTITTTADNSFLVYDASDSKWKNEGPSTARSSLGLAIGTDVQAYDADTTKNDISNTFTANQVISVSDNANAALRITQTGTGNALVVEDSSNPDSTPFVVSSDGKVFIGADTSIESFFGSLPSKLAISGTASPLIIETLGNNEFGSRIDLIKTRATTSNSKTAVSNNDTLGDIFFGGTDGTSALAAARISAEVDGTPGANDMPGRLVFSTTADGAASPTERMRIDSSGNVGIGTSSPQAKLDVTGNINATGALTLGTALAIAEGGTGQTTASAARIALLPTLGTAGQVLAVNTGTTDVEWVDASSGSGTSPGIDDNASSTALTIDSSGNVGIGTSSPAYKLDVNGDASFYGVRVGRGAGGVLTNTAVGSYALDLSTTGGYVTAIGRNALGTSTSGSYNTANGAFALYRTTGSNNTANGAYSLVDTTTGSNNTAIGFQALYNNTTGSGNFGAAFKNSSAVYAPVFDPTTESNRIVMGHTSVTNAYIQVAWTVVSDARDKTQISPIRHGLDFVNQLNPVQFKFRINRDSEETNGGKRYGFLAQEVLEVEGKDNVIVDTEDPEKLKMTNEELIPVMVKAMQEMSADIKILKAEIAMLKGN